MNLDLRDRSCLVIGGGKVAERKALSLLEAGAEVKVISPTLALKLQELSTSGKISHRNKVFEDKDLEGVFLVIVATNSSEVNCRVALLCKQKRILVNVSSPPEESTFIVPSVVERGALVIAISTEGASPALAKKIREDLEKVYGPEYGLFLERMSLLRRKLQAEINDEGLRRKVVQAVVESDVLYLLKSGRLKEADHRIAEIVKAETT